MFKIFETIADTRDAFLAWFDTALKKTTESYCELQTADSPIALVANDGSLVSILKVRGVKKLIGSDEFNNIQRGLLHNMQTAMSRPGHTVQVYFTYNKDEVGAEIANILQPARETAERLRLDLADLFSERIHHLAKYCAHEEMHIVLWTRPNLLSKEEYKRSFKDKQRLIKDKKIPPFRFTQNLIAAIPELRDEHDSFVRSVANEMNALDIVAEVLEVHEALYEVRRSVDVNFTDKDWRPALPGDKITIKETKKLTGDISDVLWPSLARQLIPRDAYNHSLRTARVGDRIYASVFIDLFPKEIQNFMNLFNRVLPTAIPWRISFLIESAGVSSLRLKSALTSVMSWTSAQNRLINDAANLLRYIDLNTDDAVVKLRVAACTWAPEDNIRLLRTRAAQLAKAIESWGSCDVSEVSGDAFAGVASTMLGITSTSVATASVAPLSDVLQMLPLFRPSSPWEHGAILFRSPDGKPWPYQPGSRHQTTWIDLIYARPGSGKSVLSNAINLALCLSSGIQRLPHIAIVDIGPSSSGLISLIKESLPYDQRHLAAYYRLRMTPEFSINPFDTQLGSRYPTPQERSFLVNFLTLLATPIGADKPYDGISDMAGLVVNELYKQTADAGKPHTYVTGAEEIVDGILDEIGFVSDAHTTWWEVTDALFMAGFPHEASLAQRHAMPILADAASICRLPAVEDLYGKITAPTGENLINAFARMISAGVREYSILSQATRFDLGEARIVALDLDEVAKSGGDAANRQTAVMYMLARYVLARHYYVTAESVADIPEAYKGYHEKRISEIREDPKRIVFDEFHRTAHTSAVRDQVVVDMREGRKWNVQIALISQSVEDFDDVMIEFATSIFIMDAGPEQAIRKTSKIFGLSETAQHALRSYVHGPREGGVTFLAQFATKEGMNTQLLTATLGPVELWAFTTTAEDVNLRNRLYRKIGPAEARRVLATVFPSGSATAYLAEQLTVLKQDTGFIGEEVRHGVIDKLLKDIMDRYTENPKFKHLA
ncbi:MAG: type IV secretion protein IcmB [Gammaproteobacteria bacterium]|nr:type IV secretion protein IcmB [Gammaproteobacteria bacterium]